MSILETFKKRIKAVEKDLNRCFQKAFEEKDFIYHSEYGICLQYRYELLKEIIFEFENLGNISELEYTRSSSAKLQKSLAERGSCLYGSSDFDRYKYLCRIFAEQEILKIYDQYLEDQEESALFKAGSVNNPQQK